MKSLFNFVGWVAFLAAVGLGLIIYNAVHLPALRRQARLQDEVRMWTSEVEVLRDSLDWVSAPTETVFVAVFTFEELFGASEAFAISSGGENTLREIVTMLRESSGIITVTGHTDSGELPARVRGLYPSPWHFSATAAAAVAHGLDRWGIAAERLRVRSAGATMPRDVNTTPAGRTRNRRVEILVLKTGAKSPELEQ